MVLSLLRIADYLPMSHKNCPTKLQVSNLAKDTTHREIEAWMASLRVGGATITKKKDSFILEFESAAQASRAKEVLSKNTYINGNICKVVHYREFMVVGEVTAVVQGLTTESNFAAIEQVIRQFSGVTEVSFKKKTTKPYAFVSFEKIDQVNNMIKELHGSWVHGDFLRIFIVNESASPNQNLGASIDGVMSFEAKNEQNGIDSASPIVKNRTTRSTSLNTQISFDTFLSNISNNLATLTPVNTTAKRNSYSNFTTFTNPTSFTNVPTSMPTISSPSTATNGNNIAATNNRKNRSKSLNTNSLTPANNSKVYAPLGAPSLMSSITSPNKSAITSPLMNAIGSPGDSVPPTKGRTVSFSEAEGVSFPIHTLESDDGSMDSIPVRLRSVSFDSNFNSMESFGGHNPGELSIALDLAPNSLNSALNLMAVDSPSRLRSKSVGTAPPKNKAASVKKDPANDLFLKQHRGSKIPNPNLSDMEDDDSSDASSVLSPSGSSTSLSMPNLHYKNDYHTLRLEGLAEEITSSLLYDLFNCVLDEPPSLLSAKAVHGQGFVDFDNAEMANLALQKLNGRKFMGHNLRISHVKPEEKCVLKVTNLPFSTDEKDLEEHFSDVAGLISANIVRKVTGISKGFAFLVFGHLSAAEKALQEKHGTIVQGRPINIRHHNSNNNNTNVARTTPNKTPKQSPIIDGNIPSTSPTIAPSAIADIQRQAIKPVRLADVTRESGEQPDDAALYTYSPVASSPRHDTSVSDRIRSQSMSEEDAQRYLMQFSQEFSQVVQKVHAIETNYTHLKERLRQNTVRIDTTKTKLAEKRLEQLNDDLAYAKQKHQYAALSSAVADIGSGIQKEMQSETSETSEAASNLELERYQFKKMRVMKQASLRKLIEELSDQLKIATIIKDIEEEKQLLDNHQVQLEMIELINSLAETSKKISIPKLKERISQSNVNVQEKTKIKEDMQRHLELKRSYDIDLDTPSPPRALSMAAWPNDEAVKVDTFQLHFTDDRFSLRCCNIQLTRASIRPKSFSRGGSHLAYWIKLATDPKAVYVAKSSISPKDPDVDTCMQYITSQLYANNTAKALNEKKFGKSIEFIPVQLLCFYQRNPQVYMTVEPALEGIWKRYSLNNSGLIDVEKNAFVHAYTHFSHEYSTGKLIVADLQGGKMRNRYYLSAPTVHYINPRDDAFGKSNLGQPGIDEFFRSHTCNRICRQMSLTPYHPRPQNSPISPPTYIPTL